MFAVEVFVLNLELLELKFGPNELLSHFLVDVLKLVEELMTFFDFEIEIFLGQESEI